MYMPDMESYFDDRYGQYFEEVLSIGWLSEEHSFPRGYVSQEIKDKLIKLVVSKARTKSYHGYHRCEFCIDGNKRALIDVGIPGKEIGLGSAEVWIPTADNQHLFAFPTMLYHYIDEHQYLPPKPFLDAVIAFSMESDWDADLVVGAIASKYRPKLYIEACILAKMYKEKVENIIKPDDPNFYEHPDAKRFLNQLNKYREMYL